jgi:hypothetical protein
MRFLIRLSSEKAQFLTSKYCISYDVRRITTMNERSIKDFARALAVAGVQSAAHQR